MPHNHTLGAQKDRVYRREKIRSLQLGSYTCLQLAPTSYISVRLFPGMQDGDTFSTLPNAAFWNGQEAISITWKVK